MDIVDPESCETESLDGSCRSWILNVLFIVGSCGSWILEFCSRPSLVQTYRSGGGENDCAPG